MGKYNPEELQKGIEERISIFRGSIMCLGGESV